HRHLARGPHGADERPGQGGLAGAGGAGDAHRDGATGVGVDDAAHLPGLRTAALGEGEQAGERAPFALAGTAEQVFGGGPTADGHAGGVYSETDVSLNPSLDAPALTTSVIPGTRSSRMRSRPALRVWV